jgi:adenosylcobinamide-GDP ribazoletransferase
MFLTRLPVPNFTPYNPNWLQQAPKYFTWVGALVGALSALIIYANLLGFNNYLIAIVYTIISILITGAFHEDGFADMCDAFGGGYTIEKKLTIMKDSRLGTYGSLGLLLIVVLKIFLIETILSKILTNSIGFKIYNSNLLFMLLASFTHSLSRYMPLLIMQLLPYVADLDVAKSKPIANSKLKVSYFIIALLPILIMAYFLPIKLSIFIGFRLCLLPI